MIYTGDPNKEIMRIIDDQLKINPYKTIGQILVDLNILTLYAEEPEDTLKRINKQLYKINNTVTTAQVLFAGLSYWRYRRQFLCVHEPMISKELGRNDILVDTGVEFIDIEIKISSSDFKHDFTKPKHEYYLKDNSCLKVCPNKLFYLVPTDLVKEVLNTADKRYGVMEFNLKDYHDLTKNNPKKLYNCISIVRGAESFRTSYDEEIRDIILKRLNSAYIQYIGRLTTL